MPKDRPAPTRPPASGRLGPRIALLALLTALVVAAATWIFLEMARGDAASPRDAQTALNDAVRAQSAYDDARNTRLLDSARLLAANGAVLDALTEPGAAQAAMISVVSGFLNQRAVEAVAVRGGTGEILASAGTAEIVTILGNAPTVQRTLAVPAASGFVARGGRLLRIAAARVEEPAGVRLGAVGVAESLSAPIALEAKRASRADAAYLMRDDAKLAASTLEPGPAGELVAALNASGAAARAFSGNASGAVDLTLAGRRYRAEAVPLVGSENDPPVAIRITLVPVVDTAAPFRRAQLVTLGALLLAAALGAGLAPLVAKKAAAPARHMAAAAEALRAGDYAAAVTMPVPEPVRALAGDLAAAESLRRLGRQLERSDTRSERATAERRPAVAVLLFDLSRFARIRPDEDPREVAARLGRDGLKLRHAVEARGGQVAGSLGHRLLATFSGEGATGRGLRAGVDALTALSAPENAFDEVIAPTAALATGTLVFDDGGRRLAGLPLQQAESLLREVGPGELALTKGAFGDIEPILSGVGLSVPSQRGILSTQPLWVLAGNALAALAAASPRSVAGSAPETLSVGSLVADRYELGEALGTEPAGVLFRARDRNQDAAVELLALRREVMRDPTALEGLDSPERGVVRVSDEHLARVFDLGVAQGGVPFLVREPAVGAGFDRLGSLRPNALAVLATGRALASALGALHRAGLAHGALRPEVLRLGPAGVVQVTGTGVAALLPAPGIDAGADRCLGSPRYLAPERLAGGAPSPAADIWSAGLMLAEMLTGQPLLPVGTPEVERAAALEGRPDTTLLSSAPAGLGSILARCLERDPGRRFASGDELQAALATLRTLG
ncbi:MAG: protein kinase [Thermoanaerobaculia bacterium]|nr:protein kinase [Thermoanaerobaculia bacterium]